MNLYEQSDDLSQQQQQQLDPFGSFERLSSQQQHQQQQQQPNYQQQQRIPPHLQQQQNYPNLNPFPSQQQKQQQQQQQRLLHPPQQNYPNLSPFSSQQEQQQQQKRSHPPPQQHQDHFKPDSFYCVPLQDGVTIKREPGVTPRFEPPLEPRFELSATHLTSSQSFVPKTGLEATSNFSSNDLSLIASINKTTVLRGLVREYIDHQRGVLEICEVGHSGLLTEPVAGTFKIS
jgi:hypothetical protein